MLVNFERLWNYLKECSEIKGGGDLFNENPHFLILPLFPQALDLSEVLDDPRRHFFEWLDDFLVLGLLQKHGVEKSEERLEIADNLLKYHVCNRADIVSKFSHLPILLSTQNELVENILQRYVELIVDHELHLELGEVLQQLVDRYAGIQ